MTICNVIDCEQRTEAWFSARLGRMTSTMADDVLAVRRDGKPSAGRRRALTQLVLERVTGKSQEPRFFSQSMQNGQEREVDARELYEAQTGVLVQQTGFLQHPELMAGCSLDGHVGDFDLITEFKSPEPHTHFEYVMTGAIPLEYQRQVLHALWLSGAKWCDWMSYHPDFPEPLRAKIVRVFRNEAEIASHELNVRLFLREVDEAVERVKALMERAA